MLLVVGSYTPKTKPGIYLYRFDPETLDFSLLKVVAGVENPSYLTLSGDGNNLLAVSESKTGDLGELSSYLVNEQDLTCKGVITYTGAGSCFVSADTNWQHAFIANYGAGTLTVLKLLDGAPSAVVQLIEFTGSGPVSERQEQSHIHAVMPSPDQRFVYCTDLGADRLYRFRYNAAMDTPLSPCDPPYINLPHGAGPRHFAFDGQGRWLYLLSELSGEIFTFSATEALSAWLEKNSIVSEDYHGQIEAGDIQMHPSGNFLYTSNRGEANEVVVFSVDHGSGRLSFLERVSAEGSSPRCMVISPDGRILLVANEQSNNVTVFRIAANGQIKYTGVELKLDKPTCVKLIDKRH